jgi:hypothetical protein
VPTIERFMVQAYREGVGGGLEPDEPMRAPSAADAIRIAEGIQQKRVGVVAYAWRGDPKNHEIGKLVVLKQIGVLPFCVLAAFEQDQIPDRQRDWPL